jgi:hypothetical protein
MSSTNGSTTQTNRPLRRRDVIDAAVQAQVKLNGLRQLARQILDGHASGNEAVALVGVMESCLDAICSDMNELERQAMKDG